MTEGTIAVAVLLHLAAVSAVLAAPLMWGRHGRRRPAGWLAYGAALALLGAWGVTSDRAGAATDEVRTLGSVLETAVWLGLALLAAAVSVLVVRRRRTPAT
ncbi:hypothetical protein [Blastococcus saxobsidens]|uniref:Uncharacterized protein n=1 Tax=Blastococcus saxobsidens TaxID=138336 RepID=A0A4Q7Y2B5_9ACTN|nr:hypothetical protein [Blastococcus saxobsidens]RZU30648.1 hypothetical protein BKA19_0270 [Blastococcus saxobsidens]